MDQEPEVDEKSEVDENSSVGHPNAKVLKLGFLGVGRLGKFRMDAIRESKLASTIFLCDPYGENTVQFCKDNNLKNIESYDALLQEDIDGVVIATPSTFHKEHIVRALDHGKSVFFQRPLATTEADAWKVIDIAKRNNCLLMSDQFYRNAKGLQKIKTLIDANELGQVHAVNLTCQHAGGPESAEYQNPEFSGEGCMMDLGINLIDVLYWMFPSMELNKIQRNLFLLGKEITNPMVQAEDYAMSQLTFSNGLTAQLCCSWNSHLGKEAIIEFNFYGTKGGATFRNVSGSLYDFKAEYYKGTKRQILSLPPDEWYGKSAAQWTALLSNKNEFRRDIELYLKTASTLDRIYAQ